MSEIRTSSAPESYETRADALLSELRSGSEDNPLQLIAIAGVSGTGKTNFALRLGEKIDSVSVLHIDNYLSPKTPTSFDEHEYIDLETNSHTPFIEGLPLSAWDLPRFIDDVNEYRKGNVIKSPLYDPTTQENTYRLIAHQGENLIIEGVHALTLPQINPEISSRILLEASLHDRLMRKIVRSSRFNKRPSLDASIRRYIEGSELAWNYYREDYRSRADYIINNSADPLVDYAQFKPLQVDCDFDYSLQPHDNSGQMADDEQLKLKKHSNQIGKYTLNYIIRENIMVSSEINGHTLELLLGYYDMEPTINE